MFADLDWCNIYHVCIGNRDNIFLCPPGTIFNDEKQGCMDRLDGTNCNGTRSYYKPTIKRQKRIDPPMPSPPSEAAGPALAMKRKLPPSNSRFTDLKEFLSDDNHQRIPYEWRKSQRSREVASFLSASPRHTFRSRAFASSWMNIPPTDDDIIDDASMRMNLNCRTDVSISLLVCSIYSFVYFITYTWINRNSFLFSFHLLDQAEADRI